MAAFHRDKYFARNKPMPVAVVVGNDPLLYLMACTEVRMAPANTSFAGGLRGKPYPSSGGR